MPATPPPVEPSPASGYSRRPRGARRRSHTLRSHLILPDALVEPFTRARLLLDRHASVPDQAVLADFIAGGHFARHIRRTRALNEERQRTFLDLAARELDGLLSVEPASAGMQLLGWLPSDVSDREVAVEAGRRGVVVEPLSRHLGVAQQAPALILGYVAYSQAATRAAIRTLAEVIRSARGTAGTSTGTNRDSAAAARTALR